LFTRLLKESLQELLEAETSEVVGAALTASLSGGGAGESTPAARPLRRLAHPPASHPGRKPGPR